MNLITLLSLESGLFFLSILLVVIYEISQRHPNAFNLPKLTLPKLSLSTPKTGSFWAKLRQDAQLIWKPMEPEFFVSPDGNTLYLSLKYTNNWLPYQVVLYMLSQKQAFLDQIKEKDPSVFEAVNTLVDKLEKAKVIVSFEKMNYLPSFQKNMLVWKLSLLATKPEVKEAIDVVVKELSILPQ